MDDKTRQKLLDCGIDEKLILQGDLSKAYLHGADLSEVNLVYAKSALHRRETQQPVHAAKGNDLTNVLYI